MKNFQKNHRRALDKRHTIFLGLQGENLAEGFRGASSPPDAGTRDERPHTAQRQKISGRRNDIRGRERGSEAVEVEAAELGDVLQLFRHVARDGGEVLGHADLEDLLE